MRWKGSSLESTKRALPDATSDVQKWACERWRDESGAVLKEVYSRFAPIKPRCKALFVISGLDTDVPPEQQAQWATEWGAPTLEYPTMSHVGPLLGTSARNVAGDVADWADGL